MASFAKMTVWPVGYYRATSSWLLRNRRAVPARLAALDAELDRLGFIKVTYRITMKDGSVRATEERTRFSVTEKSSLGRLVRAYVANGGNPLDISSFWHPDSTEVIEEDEAGKTIKVRETYPHGGVLAPRSANYNEPLAIAGDDTGYGAYRGGWANADGYYPARQGGRAGPGSYDADSVVRYMHQTRSWANQDIKERLQDIEWQIIKLCDLREQLEVERDEVLQQAFGGVLSGLYEFDSERFDPKLRVQVLVQEMYEKLYVLNDARQVVSFEANEDIVPFLTFTFPEVPSEKRDPMG